MGTAWITKPDIPYASLKAAKLPGLSQHLSDDGKSYAWTDGKNYLWVNDTGGNATFQQSSPSRNDVRRIQSQIAKKFKVDWISEHDEGFWEEGEEDQGDDQDPILSSDSSEMDLLKIAARVAAGPEPEGFMFRQSPAGPSDVVSSPAVIEEGSNRSQTLKDGDEVKWLGGVRTDVEREWTDDGPEDVELEFREVKTSDEFVGWVAWWPYDGHSGFEPLKA